MSASDDSKTPVDKRFEALVEAAGEDAIERARSQELPLDTASAALESLVEEAGGPELITAQQSTEISSTQDAMESLFIETAQHGTADPDVLLGLQGTQGIQDMGVVDDDGQTIIAGAERPDTQTNPVKRLDDGVDFWRELENIDDGSDDS